MARCCHRDSQRNSLFFLKARFCFLTGLIACCLFATGNALAQDPSDPPEAISIVQTATNAQSAGEFELAAKQWQTLLKKFPSSSYTSDAQYNSGLCFQRLNREREAIDNLKAALTTLSDDKTIMRSNALFLLGFCQKSLGQKLAYAAESKEGSEEAGMFLTTATKTLDDLMGRYPDFVDADQAYYYQGEAYEELGRLDKAEEAFAKTQTAPKQTVLFDGLYALANVAEKLGKYDVALQHYQEFQTKAAAQGGHQLLTEIEFRSAATLVQLASSSENIGETQAALQHYKSAIDLFSKVAAVPGFSMAADAIFQRAFCENRMGNHLESAKLYGQLADSDSVHAERAAVNAGREFLNAKEFGQAETWLSKVSESSSSYAPEAAHWLAQVYLENGDAEKAFSVSNAWVEKLASQKSLPVLPSLMLDRADAAFMAAARKKDSAALYLEIVDNYPTHPLGATALYNAAFAQLDTGKYPDAIELVDRFQKEHAKNDFVVDAVEIKADAYMMLGQSKEAEETFKQLIGTYPTSPKSDMWSLRAALAGYQLGKYQETIDGLASRVDSMKNKSDQAEALHWIGCSHFQLKNDPVAIQILEKALEIDDAFGRADETLLTLSQAQTRIGNSNEAAAALSRLRTSFPKSKLIAESVYRLGESAYQQNDFEQANKYYSELIANHPESAYVPYAIYNQAWSNVKLAAVSSAENNLDAATARFKEADKYFSRLIDQHGEHDLATSALIGRGASRRKLGNFDLAIKDLKEFLATKPLPQPEIDALYELGLAQIDLKAWQDASETFAALIGKAPDAPLADRFHYELAWSYYSTQRPELALKEFELISQKYGESPLASEANFHLGNAAYDREDYEKAIAGYQKCVESTGSKVDLREKASHKLAWAHYKLKDFEKSELAFRAQLADFPNGELSADAKVMVSESLMQLKKYPEAYEAYRVAKPVIEASKNSDPKFRWVSFLHGGQSANKSQKYNEAIEFVQPIIDSEETSDAFKQDAQLELGYAYQGLKQADKAKEAWLKASVSLGKTGARARCMVGDWYMERQQFVQAIDQFKLVLYGFGGIKSDESIRPWQAYAAYEAARCNFVQVKDEKDPQVKQRLTQEAIKHFEYLIKNYPEDQLFAQAQKQLEVLKKMD